ncbi:MAG TPA: DUF1569 domain-containing protein [Candidatus Sulfotelmatobacter sp.]|nr:DUF1569 domain-containing protein [Candidatus Sulfotelmatobacter sp.]
MHPITAEIHSAIAKATEGLTEEQLRSHPEGKWDSASILEHLALTYGSTARVMDKCVREGRPLATSATMRQRAARVLVLGFDYIPSGRKAPERVAPTGIGSKDALQLIFSNLEKMDEALRKCEERFGSNKKIADHPVLGPIPISGWRKFHLAHTRHHMKQIEERSRKGRHLAAAN